MLEEMTEFIKDNTGGAVQHYLRVMIKTEKGGEFAADFAP